MAKTRARKKTASQRGRASRDKGQRGERHAASALARLWSSAQRRIQDRGAERDGPDVEAGPLDIEVKHRAKSEIQAAIKGARASVRPGKRWAAIDHPTRKKPTITFDLEDFVELVLRERRIANTRGFNDGLTEAVEENA